MRFHRHAESNCRVCFFALHLPEHSLAYDLAPVTRSFRVTAMSSISSVESIADKLLSRSAQDTPLTPKSAWDSSLQEQIKSLKLQEGSKGKADVLKAGENNTRIVPLHIRKS